MAWSFWYRMIIVVPSKLYNLQKTRRTLSMAKHRPYWQRIRWFTRSFSLKWSKTSSTSMAILARLIKLERTSKWIYLESRKCTWSGGARKNSPTSSWFRSASVFPTSDSRSSDYLKRGIKASFTSAAIKRSWSYLSRTCSQLRKLTAATFSLEYASTSSTIFSSTKKDCITSLLIFKCSTWRHSPKNHQSRLSH